MCKLIASAALLAAAVLLTGPLAALLGFGAAALARWAAREAWRKM